MLKKLITENLLKAHAVIGFWPAKRVGPNDVAVLNKDSDENIESTFHFLRQQMTKDSSLSNLCLADFIAPEGSPASDFIGGFVVTAGIGEEMLSKAYEKENDDYQALLVKALADRLAEAFAEHMHERVRREFWGYCAGESFNSEELISEAYQGIRPAPGYPACPDHSEKETLFKLLDAENKIGVKLTESYAMRPAASVSGLYFSHPESRYISVGKISNEQIDDLADRKAMNKKTLTTLLSPNL